MSHDRIASTFNEWATSGRAEGLQKEHNDVALQVIEQMGVRPGQQTLDLGCGNGWATRILGQIAPGAGAVGIDVSPEMIRAAEAGHDFTYRARYEVGTFEALDFPDAKFDRAFSMEALYYAVDLDQAINELFRVLKPQGTADVVIDRYHESPHTESWAATMDIEMHWLGEGGWRTAFERAGFQPVATSRVIDSRGPGDESDFKPDAHCPDYRTRVERYAAGSLWIHAEKPA